MRLLWEPLQNYPEGIDGENIVGLHILVIKSMVTKEHKVGIHYATIPAKNRFILRRLNSNKYCNFI